MNLLASFVHDLAEVWYGMAGWLPRPLQVVTFVIVSGIGLRVALRHVVPMLARMADEPLHWSLRALVWGLAVPEFVLTSSRLRRDNRMPFGAFQYGEGLAVFLESAESAVTTFVRWAQKSPKIAAHTPIWGVVAVIFLVNAAAYQNNQPLPLALWWDSVGTWAQSLK